MINVSSAFKAALNINPCKERARLITLDGTLFNLTQEDFSISNNSFTDGAGASTLPVGAAISHTVSGSLINETGKFTGHDLYGAELTVWLSLELESGKVEEILMGTFRVTSARGDDVLTIAAQDDMYRADTEYAPPDGTPSLLVLYKDICTKCGLSSGITDFANSSYTPAGLTVGYTARQMLGYIAMMAGGNVYIDHNGLLRIRSYDPTATAADTLTGWKTFEPDTVDTTITGLCCSITDTDGNTQKITSGEEGYMLTLENPLFSGQEQTALDLIAAKLVGLTFRKCSGDHVAYPMLECMDVINAIDRKGNQYKTIVTDVTFNWFGLTNIKNSAASSSEQGRTYTTPESAAVIASRKLVAAERTARETAIAQLNKQLSDTPGLYKTVEDDGAGGSIYYFSDKPTVKESSVVLKLTASALGISTDGGKTYSWGANFLTGDGVMNIIIAKGINAEWVNVDDLSAFNATIGGFHLSDKAMYSGAKAGVDNTTQGIYMDSTGQLATGDSTRYLKHYKDAAGTWHLEICTDEMTIDSDNFKLTKDGTVTAKAGNIGGWELMQDTVGGINRRYLFGGYKSDNKLHGIRLLPQASTDDWDGSVEFFNGADDSKITIEAARKDTADGFNYLSISGAPVVIPNLQIPSGGNIYMPSGKSVIDEAVDAVQVGGANLILNSRTLNGVSVTGTILANQYRGCSAVLTTGAWQGIYFDLAGAASRGAIKAGDVVTMSVMVMTDFDAATPCFFTLYRAPKKLDYIHLGYYTLQPHTWQKISVSFTVPDGDLSNTARIETDYYVDSSYTFGGKHMYFAAPKLEFGNKATDWTPAPEDVDADISALSTDYIVAEDISGAGWLWRKWSSGQAECWSYWSIYYANPNVLTRTIALPFTFSEVDACVVSSNNAGGNASSALHKNAKVEYRNTSVTVVIHDPLGNFSEPERASVLVLGRWK